MFAYRANSLVGFKDPSGFERCMSNECYGEGGFRAIAVGSGALADTIKGLWYGAVGQIIITFSINNKKFPPSSGKDITDAGKRRGS